VGHAPECCTAGAVAPGGRSTDLPDDDRPDPHEPGDTVRTRLALTTALATALLLTSCGGSSDDAGAAGSGASAGTLTVATEGTYSPFSFHDQANGGELTGYDVEVAKAVGAKLGMDVKFAETPFDSIFAGLEAKRFDMIANQIGVNPDRQAKYLFSTPYTYSNGVVITRADDTSVSSLADIAGKTSAQSTTSNFAKTATDAGAKIEAVEGFTQAITLLKQSRVDVTVNDSLAFLEYQKTTGDKDVKVAAELDDKSQSALTFRKDETDLQTKVNGALDALAADGTLTKLSEKYFGEDVSKE
jgi:cystine transport system substrate-binding protein